MLKNCDTCKYEDVNEGEWPCKYCGDTNRWVEAKGDSMDVEDLVVNKQREILDALEPETLKDMIFDLWAALDGAQKDRDDWTAAYGKELKIKCDLEKKFDEIHQEALMWERNAVAAQAREATAIYELEEEQLACNRVFNKYENACTEIKVKQALIDNFKLDDLMDMFKKELAKQIAFTFEISREKALNDAIDAVYAAGGNNEGYHIEAIKRKFGVEI
jgi:hypothetical protein